MVGGFYPRKWQAECIRRYQALNQRDFLMVVTPGGGKTKCALAIAAQAIGAGEARRLIVVCPSEPLKIQWAEAAAEFGLHLDPTLKNADGFEPEDFHGYVTTYASVGTRPRVHQIRCDQGGAFVIFDEIHHCGTGEDLAWGDGIRSAFHSANRRLALSGTPFRSDNNPIPFVRYLDGKCQWDYEFGYGNALVDPPVCRMVSFPTLEGEMKWVSRGDLMTAAFADELPDKESQQRLRTSLSHDSEVLRDLLRNANDRLTEIRSNGHPDAGGLVVCIDQPHAQKIAAIIERISGEQPTVAISENPEAFEDIRRFRDSTRKWIVAVRMVSEGVDIKRLRVGVYASNIVSQLFFNQFVGRFVRVIGGMDDETAYVFLPAEKRLLDFAHSIKKIVAHHVKEEADKIIRESRDTQERELQADLTAGGFMSLSAKAGDWNAIFEEQVYTEEELANASELAMRVGIFQAREKVAALLRLAGGTSISSREKPQTVQTKADERSEIRAHIKSLAARLSYLESNSPDMIKVIHARLNERIGKREQKQFTVDELRRKRDLLIAEIERWEARRQG